MELAHLDDEDFRRAKEEGEEEVFGRGAEGAWAVAVAAAGAPSCLLPATDWAGT